MTAIHTFQKCNIPNAKHEITRKTAQKQQDLINSAYEFSSKKSEMGAKNPKLRAHEKLANAKIRRTRTFSVVKSISKYLILPLQIIPFSNRPFFQFYFMVSLFNSFLLVSKFVPFLEIVWNSFFFFQKNRSLKKVTHSSFLCLSAHASPKALLPLRYLGPPTHKREIFPRYTYNSKSEYRIIIQRKNAGRKVGHGACGVILRNGVPHNW